MNTPLGSVFQGTGEKGAGGKGFIPGSPTVQGRPPVLGGKPASLHEVNLATGTSTSGAQLHVPIFGIESPPPQQEPLSAGAVLAEKS